MLIEIDRLRLSLGGVPILHDVHLSLGQGEIYGLLGPNGAGKSTTIAAALGMLQPDAGQVRMFGKNPRQAPRETYARLGVLPEQSGFYDWMSGEDYLGFFSALHYRPIDSREIRRRLSDVGLDPAPRQTIGTYSRSRGMRQRLGLARALLADPELLILDEPTNGLDPRGRREIHDVLLDRARNGTGILLCTHLLDDVERLCRRIGIIAEGRTAAEGILGDLIQGETRRMRFRLRLTGQPPSAAPGNVSVVAREGEWWVVDLDAAAAPDAAWRDLLFRGWPIAEIRREGGDLEDLYLAVTGGNDA